MFLKFSHFGGGGGQVGNPSNSENVFALQKKIFRIMVGAKPWNII
jgi:hypothetical protein